MIKGILIFLILQIISAFAYGDTCTCATYFEGAVPSYCVGTDNGCSGANEACPCSQRSVSNCQGNVEPVNCVTANFDAPSSNTCSWVFEAGVGCIANENNGCSQTEVCACSQRSFDDCTSAGSGSCAPIVLNNMR